MNSSTTKTTVPIATAPNCSGLLAAPVAMWANSVAATMMPMAKPRIEKLRRAWLTNTINRAAR